MPRGQAESRLRGLQSNIQPLAEANRFDAGAEGLSRRYELTLTGPSLSLAFLKQGTGSSSIFPFPEGRALVIIMVIPGEANSFVGAPSHFLQARLL